MVSVTHNEIINAIVLAENVAYMNAQARAIVLGNGEIPCASDNAKAIEIEQWIAILERAEVNVTDECLDDEIIWQLIQNINEQYRGVDCDVSRTFSRNSSSGGGTNVPTGYVERVLGVNVDNSNPSRPVVTIYVDGVTITGNGTEADPFVAVGGGGGTVISVNGLTGAVVLTTTNISEGTRLYFTTARVLATALTGLSITGSAITSSDTILQAFGKLQNQINGISTPDLQQVTDVGGETTNKITSGDGAGNETVIGNGAIRIETGGARVIINATLATQPYTAQLPNKSAGTETFAMLSDIASVPATNLSNTPAPTKITVNSSTGTGTDLPLADATNAGLLKPAKFTVLENTSGTNTGDNATNSQYSGLAASKADVASPTFTGTVTTPAIIVSSETASRVAIIDASKNVKSADTATYPSLTEFSYGKGVTSAIQTQLDAKASKTFVESISLQDNGTSIAATTYTIELYANYAYTINELKIIAYAGTCTANLKINSTSVTGISAVSVSSTIATATASGANTVAVGDKITLVTTSNSGLNNLQLTIKTTRI